ncbi:DMT family transporter [Effusibacillus pohliae]|uniref:DMT family transporter n=1 Tax=Effusibacillus pohliae TaxID=232270 RepID=UPI0003801B08|nr:DMT family transporter [Effusibacillus pohliae]
MSRSLYLSLAVLSLIWGGSFFFIKILLRNFDPWSIAFLRITFGLLAVVLVIALSRQRIRLQGLPWFPLLVVGLFNTVIPWGLIGFSETRLTSSMASILNATTPLWSTVIGMLLFQGKPTRNHWLGIGIGFFGLLVLLDVNPATIVSVDPTGLLCMLAAAIFYGFSSHYSKRHFSELSVYEISFGTLFAGAVASGLLTLLFGDFSVQPLVSWTNGLAFLGLGAFGSGIAFVLFFHLVQKGSPELATMVTYLVPGTAIVWGALLLNEPVTWNLLIGLVLILSGVYVSNQTGSILPRKHLHSSKAK